MTGDKNGMSNPSSRAGRRRNGKEVQQRRPPLRIMTREEKEARLEEVLKSKSFVLDDNTSLLSMLMRSKKEKTSTTTPTMVEQRNDDDRDTTDAQRPQDEAALESRQDNNNVGSNVDHVAMCGVFPASYFGPSSKSPMASVLVEPEGQCDQPTTIVSPSYRSSARSHRTDTEVGHRNEPLKHEMLNKSPQSLSPHDLSKGGLESNDLDVTHLGMEMSLETLQELGLCSKNKNKVWKWGGSKPRDQRPATSRRRKRRGGYSFAVLDV